MDLYESALIKVDELQKLRDALKSLETEQPAQLAAVLSLVEPAQMEKMRQVLADVDALKEREEACEKSIDELESKQKKPSSDMM